MNAISKFHLYLKLRPDINRLKDLYHMKISTNVIGQSILVALHMLNILTGFVPAEKKAYVMAAIAGLQAILSAVAHYSNPDGTPAAQPNGMTPADLAAYEKIFGGAGK